MENVKHKDFNVELTGVDSKVCCDIFALAMPVDTAMPTKLPLASGGLVGIAVSIKVRHKPGPGAHGLLCPH